MADTFKDLVLEVLADPPYDEIWCSFCGRYPDHDADCWTIRAAAAIAAEA